MTTPPTEIFGLLPCPVCSYLRADHPELLKDVLALPSVWQGRSGKRWYLGDRCYHGRGLFGPYESEDSARAAWNGMVHALLAEAAVIAGSEVAA